MDVISEDGFQALGAFDEDEDEIVVMATRSRKMKSNNDDNSKGVKAKPTNRTTAQVYYLLLLVTDIDQFTVPDECKG